MAAQQSQGIQTLLEAEKEASKIVAQARGHRVQRLKDARAEAEKEIAAYKTAKEQEYQQFLASRTSLSTSSQSEIDKETDAKLATLEQEYLANKDAVVKMLLDRVMEVKPELHRNLKKVGA